MHDVDPKIGDQQINDEGFADLLNASSIEALEELFLYHSNNADKLHAAGQREGAITAKIGNVISEVIAYRAEIGELKQDKADLEGKLNDMTYERDEFAKYYEDARVTIRSQVASIDKLRDQGVDETFWISEGRANEERDNEGWLDNGTRIYLSKLPSTAFIQPFEGRRERSSIRIKIDDDNGNLHELWGEHILISRDLPVGMRTIIATIRNVDGSVEETARLIIGVLP